MHLFKRLILYAFVATLLLGLCTFAYLENCVSNVIDPSELAQIYKDIEETEALPAPYLKAVKKHFPEKFEHGVWRDYIQSIFLNKFSRSCCSQLYFGPLKGESRMRYHMLAFDLDDRFGAEKCYAYEMRKRPYNYNVLGLELAASTFFDKEVDQLTEREIVGLEFIKRDATLYNPLKNPDRLKKAVDKVMSQ